MCHFCSEGTGQQGLHHRGQRLLYAPDRRQTRGGQTSHRRPRHEQDGTHRQGTTRCKVSLRHKFQESL